MGIERVINEVSRGTEGVSILFHTGKSLERGFAIVLTKKKEKKEKRESISTVFRYREERRENHGGN